MGTVGAGFSMSLDGFVADEQGDTSKVFAWMFAGTSEVNVSSGDTEFDLKMSDEDAQSYEDMIASTGAIVTGRGMFDMANAWGGKHPLNAPVIVLTHDLNTVPEQWRDDSLPFTYITDGGVESAIAKAKEIARDKNIGVGGADVARQCLKAGLLDEIGINLVPVLLGRGVRLFDYMGIEPLELEIKSVTPGVGVTHLIYGVK